MALGFESCGPLTLDRPPRMRFVYLRPELCLRLPSDRASRRRRCRSTHGSRHQGPQRTHTSWSFHGSLSLTALRVAKSNAACHAWHTASEWGGICSRPDEKVHYRRAYGRAISAGTGAGSRTRREQRCRLPPHIAGMAPCPRTRRRACSTGRPAVVTAAPGRTSK